MYVNNLLLVKVTFFSDNSPFRRWPEPGFFSCNFNSPVYTIVSFLEHLRLLKEKDDQNGGRENDDVGNEANDSLGGGKLHLKST